jgi:hypothetical protein
VGRKLFGKVGPAPALLRRTEVWHWLTPAAACVLTLMVVVNTASRHLPRMGAPDKASFFATLMFDTGVSNMQRTFVLSKMDENVEWNVWSHPFPSPTGNILNVLHTNR